MARRVLSSFVELWQKHESLYVKVFSVALLNLARGTKASGDEDAISETLCPILNQVCFDLSKCTNKEVRTPTWEGPIQPVAESELKGGKIRKRPDFTCKCSNPFADSSEEYEIPLHVECKRLGNPTSPSWNLNENYVCNGVKRFDSDTHEYGKRALSGIMIGYIVSMSSKDIISEVNAYLSKIKYSNIRFDFTQEILHTRQAIERNQVAPSQFELVHLWVDLRNSP
jgi:hypothetical protein